MNSKKLTTKNVFYVAIAMLCMSILFFDSCKDEDKNGTVYDPSQPLALTSFTPDSGRISEKIILEGSNFGTDTSLISVYFNQKKAYVVGSTGTRMLVLTPRLPGDTCILTVKVGDKEAAYPDLFRYKIMATASTLAGNGDREFLEGPLDECQLAPVYMTVDAEDNLIVTTEAYNLVKINPTENTMELLAIREHGIGPSLLPIVNPVTGDIVLGGQRYEGGTRNRFLFLSPNEGYIPKPRYIREWYSVDGEKIENIDDEDDTRIPVNNDAHLQVMYCVTDSCYYTIYLNRGLLVKVNPTTWDARVIYKIPVPPGEIFGAAFHPLRPNELWFSYPGLIVKLDVRDPAGTFEKVSNGMDGHRDGRMEQALFNDIRQINFDAQGNLFIGDNGNHCIRKIDTETMMVETVIGIPGSAGSENGSKDEARFLNPHGLVVDSQGIIYVADFGNALLRRIAIE